MKCIEAGTKKELIDALDTASGSGEPLKIIFYRASGITVFDMACWGGPEYKKQIKKAKGKVRQILGVDLLR